VIAEVSILILGEVYIICHFILLGFKSYTTPTPDPNSQHEIQEEGVRVSLSGHPAARINRFRAISIKTTVYTEYAAVHLFYSIRLMDGGSQSFYSSTTV
jgi:hypothetical protein